LAGAEALETRNFIFCYFSGGWDILLGLDPRDPQLFREDNRSETLIQPAYDLLGDPDQVPLDSSVDGMWFGPYIGRMRQHADKMAIIRGMSMDTLTHQAGRRRFLTGKPPSGILARGSSMSAVLSAQFGPTSPIMNLSGGVESFNVDQPNYASALTVANVDDLLRALRYGSVTLDSLEDEQVSALLKAFETCRREERSDARMLAHESRWAAENLVKANLDRYFDFTAGTTEMAEVRSHYGIGNRLDTPNASAAMAVAAITNGISRCASVQVVGGLDTHYENWTDEQGPIQRDGFDLVAAIVEDLASKPYKGSGSESWLDHTTIIGFSEFSRTAMLNANTGRDHSLTNACFLLGAGIKGGQVIGASSDVGMSPQPVDLATGQLDPGGEVIRPEHIHRSLLEGLGVMDDVADLRVPSIPALLS
jgi:uncharacterized protein (DUF1501 family)